MCIKPLNKNDINKILMVYPLILLLYKDPGSGIRKALFSRIPDPLKKAKDPADPDPTDPDPDTDPQRWYIYKKT